eukprot:753784-Hanusia_phi.AAC.2
MFSSSVAFEGEESLDEVSQPDEFAGSGKSYTRESGATPCCCRVPCLGFPDALVKVLVILYVYFAISPSTLYALYYARKLPAA